MPAASSRKRTKATKATINHSNSNNSSTECLCNQWREVLQHSKACRKGNSNLVIARVKAIQA